MPAIARRCRGDWMTQVLSLTYTLLSSFYGSDCLKDLQTRNRLGIDGHLQYSALIGPSQQNLQGWDSTYLGTDCDLGSLEVWHTGGVCVHAHTLA